MAKDTLVGETFYIVTDLDENVGNSEIPNSGDCYIHNKKTLDEDLEAGNFSEGNLVLEVRVVRKMKVIDHRQDIVPIL